jgi:5-formyltetrahydrofolate cyclo-ligase
MKAEKRLLRQQMRAKREAAHDPHLSAQVCARVLTLAPYAAARTVFVYYAVGSEVDTRPLIDEMIAGGKQVCLPSIRGQGLMDARRMDAIEPGPYGIPAPRGAIVPPDQIDLVLVPGLAFDPLCRRLGQGGGYYDRYLAACFAPSVGLAYACQMLDVLPIEPHDTQLDYVVTEKKLYRRPCPRD